MLVKLAKTHSSEAFVACDDPLEGVNFSVFVEILKRLDKLEADKKGTCGSLTLRTAMAVSISGQRTGP